jgi:hypothetical protein
MEQKRQEKRLSHQLITYWKRLNKNNSLPDIRQFNPSAIGPLWQYCMRIVISNMGEKRVFSYEYMGSEIAKAYGTDLTGQRVSSNIRTIPGSSIIRKLDSSIPMREPVLEQGQFINSNNEMIKYRSCILPFGDKEYDLSHAIIGLSWKVF